jgi:hypothetical protein
VRPGRLEAGLRQRPGWCWSCWWQVSISTAGCTAPAASKTTIENKRRD